METITWYEMNLILRVMRKFGRRLLSVEKAADVNGKPAIRARYTYGDNEEVRERMYTRDSKDGLQEVG